MPHRPCILKNLIIIPALVRLIAKEMNRRVLDPTALLFRLHVFQAVRLVPARGEDIKGELAPDAEREAVLRELGAQGGDEVLPDVVGEIVGLVGGTFGAGSVTADGGDVDHAVSVVFPSVPCCRELFFFFFIPPSSCPSSPSRNVKYGNVHIPKLHKRPPLHRYLQRSDIPQHKIHQSLVFFLAQPGDEIRAREGFSQPVGRQPVLGEAEVEEGCYGERGRAELFLLFNEVGAADEADGAFVAEGGEEGEGFGRDGLEGEERGVSLGGRGGRLGRRVLVGTGWGEGGWRSLHVWRG